jgi:DNA-binding MarR family transcriptional regulator
MTDQPADHAMPWPEIEVPGNHADVLSAWLHADRAIEIVKTEMTARMEAQAGCTMLEHHALYRLATAADRRLSMLCLAEGLATSPSGATRVVERLVKRGWVVREQPPENRRQTDAVLTPAGYRALVEQTRPAYHGALTECFSSMLTAHDLEELRRIGRKLLEGHDQYLQKWLDVRFDQ